VHAVPQQDCITSLYNLSGSATRRC
jgi:hypothetical protein